MKTILLIPILILLFGIHNFSWAQFISVSGYVNHETNGKALESVNVFETNSEIGTISNQNGYYKLLLEKGSINLSFTSDGFQPFTKTLELKSDTTLIVELQPSTDSKSKHKKSDEIHADIEVDKKTSLRRLFKLN